MADYILKLFDRDLVHFSAWNAGRTPQVHIKDADTDALSLMPMGMEVTDRGLASWLKHRKVPRNRAYVTSFLAKFGLSENSTLGITDICRGLSINDSYWVVPEGFTKTFAGCNLYDRRLSEAVALAAFAGTGNFKHRDEVLSPEFTTHGMLSKCWRRHGGRICLYKGGTEGASNTGNEPYSEYYAWQIAGILGVRAIPYTLTKWNSVLCSRCELFTSREVSYVPAGNVVREGGIGAVYEYCERLGTAYTDSFEDMIVLDAVIANTDRHLGNFGFLADAASNTIISPAPLFDHGNSLFNYASQKDMETRQAFLDYGDRLLPACYSDFFAVAQACVRPRHRDGLRRLLDVRLKRHPRYNLAPKRLKLVEFAIQKRASRLLGCRSDGGEIKFW